MSAVHSLNASADIAETAGRKDLAEFWRGMANDAAAVGPALYTHWAEQVRDYVATRLMPASKGEGA